MSTVYERESISIIRNRVLKTLAATDCPYSFRGVLGSALSGMSHMMHGHIDFLARNLLPDTATEEVLDRWAWFFGVQRRNTVSAKIILEVSGHKGSRVPKDWVVAGKDFSLENEAFFDAHGRATVVCVGLNEPDDFIHVSSATLKVVMADVSTEALITGRSKAIPQESDESLRARLFQAARAESQGGSVRDYVRWVQSVPGVRNAWVKPWHLVEGGKPGHVWVTWLEDDLLQSETVQKEIESLLARLAPATASVSVKSSKVKVCEVLLQVLPNTKECRDSIEKAVKGFFNSVSRPGGYLDENLEKTPSFIAKSQLSAAISAVPQEVSHTIDSPLGDIPIGDGELVQCQVKFV